METGVMSTHGMAVVISGIPKQTAQQLLSQIYPRKLKNNLKIHTKKAKLMSNPDRTIRNERLAERQRRNNAWTEPAYDHPRRTDAEILAGVPDHPETPKQRIKRRLSAL